MVRNKNINRIGIFDSGVGGLTVLKKLLKLPLSDFIYVGDTANLPYGEKKPEQIINFSNKITNFLVSQEIDALVIACHTSSAIALPHLQKSFPNIPIIGTIDSMLPHALQQTKNNNIGVIATQASINSHMHKNELVKLNSTLNIFEQACPKLVPLIESSMINSCQIQEALHEYLVPLLNKNIDTLILGCTHYSLLSEQIKNITGRNVALVSSEEMIAQIIECRTMGTSSTNQNLKIYITGNDLDDFEQKAKIILEQPVKVGQLKLSI